MGPESIDHHLTKMKLGILDEHAFYYTVLSFCFS